MVTKNILAAKSFSYKTAFYSGVMVVSTVIDHGLDPLSGKIKDYKIGICCFSTVNIAKAVRTDLLVHTQDIALSSKNRLVSSESG